MRGVTRIRVDEVDTAGEGTGYSGSLLCQSQLQNYPQTARGHPEDGWAAVNEDISKCHPLPTSMSVSPTCLLGVGGLGVTSETAYSPQLQSRSQNPVMCRDVQHVKS